MSNIRGDEGWGPAEYSAHSPSWPFPWATQQVDTYNPRHWLAQNPTHRYSQSEWKPKRTALQQLRHPENYVIPLSTYVPEPNPYTDLRWVAMNRSREEIGRMGQDIDWNTLGTRGA